MPATSFVLISHLNGRPSLGSCESTWAGSSRRCNGVGAGGPRLTMVLGDNESGTADMLTTLTKTSPDLCFSLSDSMIWSPMSGGPTVFPE